MANYFYFDQNNQKQGPVSREQIGKLADQGIISPNHHVQKEGTNELIAAKRIISDFRFKEEGMSPESSATPGIFDIHFTRFFENIYITIIWIIVIVAHFIAAIGAVFYSINVESAIPFLIALFAIPLSLLCWRMALELDKVVFRIEKNTRATKDLLREIKEQLGEK